MVSILSWNNLSSPMFASGIRLCMEITGA